MSDRRPSRRDRTRPLEVLGLAAAAAVFVGVGVFMSTRSLLLAVEFAGGGFVVALVVIATLILATSKPDPGRDDRPGPDAGH